jgi:hypothetical protein
MGGERLSWHILLIPLQLGIVSLLLESVVRCSDLLYIKTISSKFVCSEYF